MDKGTKLFRVFGIDVKLHYSWWFIFALLAYSLSSTFFPHYYGGLSTKLYWAMGITSALLLFFSVLMHELTHSIVARLKKIKVESITLFFFGGVAELPTEDLKPWTEFWMALSGPLFSIVFGIIFLLISKISMPIYLTAIASYLGSINLILAFFNLLPGYPLDGGRVFRALLMMHYKDIRKATWIASRGGKFVGGFLAFFGLFLTFGGGWNGLWFIFLGGFLWFIAGLSYDQVLLKEALQTIDLRKLIEKKYIAFTPETTFDKVIGKYYHEMQDSFVVEKKGKFLGVLDLRRISQLPQESWKKVMVRSLMVPADKIKAVQEKDDCYLVFKKMAEQKLNLLPVLEKGKIKGVVTKRKLSHYLMLGTKYGFKV